MENKAPAKHSFSLKSCITIMFVVLAITLEAVFAAFWLFVLAPRLEIETASDLNSLAQAHALSLADALSRKQIQPETVISIIDEIFLLEDPVTKEPLVLGVELMIDYDVLAVPEGSLDLNRWQTVKSNYKEKDLLDSDIPLFDRHSKELLGIARFYGSRVFFDELKSDVMRTFFMATIVGMILLFVCWLLLIILLRPLNQMAMALSLRKASDTGPLPKLKGWASKEIRLVKNALNELFGSINRYTQGLVKLNVIFKTQQEASLDGILVISENGEIVSYNNRFVEMWQAPDGILAHPTSERIRQHMLDQLVDPETSLARILHLRKNPDKKSQVQIPLKDGRIFERYSSPMIGEDGFNYGRVWYFHDITEQKIAEENIRNLNKDLERRVRERTAQLENTNKELEAFSYSVSHDLRAPLRHIDGFSSALLEDYEDQLQDDAKSYLNLIRDACTLMGQLIDDMLNLSRIGRQEFRRATVDLTAMVTKIAAELQRQKPERDVEFSIGAGHVVEGDERLLYILLENLLNNAWKFSRLQTPAKIIFDALSFDQAEKSGYAGKRIFFIQDNGAGFDMTYAGKMFGAFQRLHRKDEFEGTGIGLATVQRVINRHEGKIWAEGKPGQGAIFYFIVD